MKRFLLLFSVLFLLCTVPVPLQAAQESSIAPGIYTLVSAANPDFVLDVRTCTKKPATSGRRLQLYLPLGTDQQNFYLEKLPQNTYRFSAVCSGLALTASTDKQSSCAYPSSGFCWPVQLSSLKHKAGVQAEQAQSWRLLESGDGCFYLASRQKGYLTAELPAYNGSFVSLQNFTGDANQKWILKKSWISGKAAVDTDLPNPYDVGGKYDGLCLSMWFGSKKETLCAQQIAQWMTETKEHTIVMEDASLQTYVHTLADRYQTKGRPHLFQTSAGTTILLENGSYGWELDEEATADQLKEALLRGSSCFLEPVWKQKAAILYNGMDIAGSYIEVNLTAQKVWLYQDGSLILETDCVSGTMGTDRQTPDGVYSIYYRESPAVLNGPGYSSPVEYWMAFNGGIGLHDANWRSEFGGEIYQTNGSHGCINLPTDAAAQIFKIADYGYPVVCYYE